MPLTASQLRTADEVKDAQIDSILSDLISDGDNIREAWGEASQSEQDAIMQAFNSGDGPEFLRLVEKAAKAYWRETAEDEIDSRAHRSRMAIIGRGSK